MPMESSIFIKWIMRILSLLIQQEGMIMEAGRMGLPTVLLMCLR